MPARTVSDGVPTGAVPPDVALELDELRDRFDVESLDPAMAALADDEVRREDFERPGVEPPPLISTVSITDHPPVDPPPHTPRHGRPLATTA